MGKAAEFFYFCIVKNRLILLSLLAVLSCAVRPDETLSPGRTVSSDHLSNPNVRCFRQDALGRMWIGTERGLNRYNGYDFHQYFYEADTTTLPDNRIYDICLDDKDRIWVGTESGVALYTDEDRFVRIPIVSEEKAVHQILCDKKGRILLNMQEDLCVYDSLSCSFVSTMVGFDRFFSYHSRCFFDVDGLLWVVFPREIRCFDTDSFLNVDNFPTPHVVTESAILSDGQLWLSGQKRMSVFDTRTRRFLKMPEKVVQGLPKREIQMIAETDTSTVLFKTSDGGFHFYDRQADVLQAVLPDQLGLQPGFDATSFYRDALGDLWLGSDDRGFQTIPFPSEALRSGRFTRHVLDNKSVVSMSRDRDGILWLFTLHDGLFRYDSSTNSLTSVAFSGAPPEDQTDFLQTNPPLVQASSDGSLYLAFPNQQQILHGQYQGGTLFLKNRYSAFYPRVSLEDEDGNIWFGTRNEYLARISPGSTTLEWIQIFPYQTTFINCLLLLGDEILIGAYDEPLTLVDRHTLQTRPLDIASRDMSPAFFYPTDFLLDRAGDIWIGTRFNGLLKYDVGRKSLSGVSGSPSGDIASIEEDDTGRIWVSSSQGLSWYEPSEEKFYDYLPPQRSAESFFYERASSLLTHGLLAFGGAQGLTLVSPSDSPDPEPVPLVFEDIRIHNRTVKPGEGIIDRHLSGRPQVTLRHLDNSFSISFAAPDFRNLQQVRYSYKLEGYDRDWVETGSSHEVYFANVPAGKYVFRVRRQLEPDDGNYLENSLSIRVIPSPWLSPWLLAVYSALVLLAAAFLWRLRRNILLEREAAREAEKEKEHERKVNQMNMTFFSNISHEFRTPLTMIAGPVNDLARSGRLGQEDVQLITTIRHSVRRMLSLVNQVMDISKLDSSAMELRVRKTDLIPILDSCMELFRLNAESLGLTLDERGLEYPLQTWLDEDKIHKIMSNLLSNAVKFTPRGGTVSLSVEEVREGDARFVQMSVADTGPGIPEDQREKVFDRYYQLDKDRKGRINYGTGIGLFYARSLAILHHGTLTVSDRNDGQGAVFTLSIPMDESAYTESERILSERPVNGIFPMETLPATLEDVPEGNLRPDLPILLAVDDDPEVVRYLVALFSGSYQVLSAYGADEALRLALDRSPDLVLSDVAMPGKDGFQLCRDFKSNLQLCHIPVILVTAMGTIQNQVQGLDLGADAYVTKPFDPAYLRALVKSQLENRRRVQNLVNAATMSSEVDPLTSRDRAFLDQLYALMEKELSNEDLDMGRMTELMKISRTKFYYKIKGLTGKTPSEFFMQYKLNMAAKLLKEGDWNVSEIAIRTGFKSLPHFSKAFKKQFGVPPSKYCG